MALIATGMTRIAPIKVVILGIVMNQLVEVLVALGLLLFLPLAQAHIRLEIVMEH
jgi:hypothetical protein